LSAAIGYSPLHATLQSKQHVDKTLSVVNKRHRLAQMAGRASVEFYVGLALKAKGEKIKDSGKGRGIVEEAFVIRVFKNGLAVFISKWASCHDSRWCSWCYRLGLEGLITFTKETHTFDAENYSLSLPTPSGGKVDVSVFDKVMVGVTVEKDKNTQRGKVVMRLVGPVDSDDL
jgi:exosome complex exonuclease DIS3/RRP44